MRKKNYKGRVEKRTLPLCNNVCRTYDALQYQYATLLSKSDDVESFDVNVSLEGLEIGAYTSDFVIHKKDGGIAIRECVFRSKLTRPLTCKLLDASRLYWKSHGVNDWGIVIDKEKEGVENDA